MVHSGVRESGVWKEEDDEAENPQHLEPQKNIFEFPLDLNTFNIFMTLILFRDQSEMTISI